MFSTTEGKIPTKLGIERELHHRVDAVQVRTQYLPILASSTRTVKDDVQSGKSFVWVHLRRVRDDFVCCCFCLFAWQGIAKSTAILTLTLAGAPCRL